MKKLFISQPMRGKTNEEIIATREKAIESAKRELGEDVEVIDSFFKDAPVDANPLWYLAKSIEMLSQADVAYFAKGWEDARGCRIENTCAIEYGIELIIEDYTADETKTCACEKAKNTAFDHTIEAMRSPDYKERFKAEYQQTKIRYEKLKAFNTRIEAGERYCFGIGKTVEAPKHDCPFELLVEQQHIMGQYLHILEVRAVIEGVDLHE